MVRFLLCIIFSLTQINLFSQIIVNEVVFENEYTIGVELFNESTHTVKIESLGFVTDNNESFKEYKDCFILSGRMIVLDLELAVRKSEIRKFMVRISTDDDLFYATYNGCFLEGESVGRCPDISGDFIVYNHSQVTPGTNNYIPGILVKKSSKTDFSPRDSSPNAALYFDGKYWIFGGYIFDNESGKWDSKANIWNSPDGLGWSLVNSKPPFTQYSCFVVFKNKMMVYWGDTVFISTDGVKWVRHQCNAFTYENYRIVVFRNKLYVLSFDTTFISEDGIIWTAIHSDFPVEEFRYLPAFVSSGDKLWLYGGETNHNDVWNSRDGIHWKKILDHAPWSPRIWFNYTYFDNKIWLIAGSDQDYSDTLNYGNKNDFWYSTDGTDWTLLKSDSAYHNRHASFLWNDGKRILISSGFGNERISRMYNDVWQIDPPVAKTSSGRKLPVCENSQMTVLTYNIRGYNGASVTGLPPGVNSSYSDGVLTISGVPSEAGSFSFHIIPNGSDENPALTDTLTVYPKGSLSLTSERESASQFIWVNTPIQKITYEAPGADRVMIDGLPAGLTFSNDSGFIKISGVPRQPGIFNYRINVYGTCVSAFSSGEITVNYDMIYPNPTSGTVNILNIGPFSLSIYDMSGRKIFNNLYNEYYSHFEKDFSDILKTSGPYLFVIKNTKTNLNYSQKILVLR